MQRYVHEQSFMLTFGNILLQSGIRQNVAGQVVTKLHEYEALSVASPDQRPYPTPSMYTFGGHTEATFAQGLAMLQNIEKQAGNLKRVYGVASDEFKQFVGVTQTLNDHLLRVATDELGTHNPVLLQEIALTAMKRKQTFKRAMEHHFIDVVAKRDTTKNGIPIK